MNTTLDAVRLQFSLDKQQNIDESDTCCLSTTN